MIAAEISADLDDWLGRRGDELIALRRDFHRHPEPSGEEHRTTAVIADRLAAAGLDATPLPGGTGLVVDVGSDDGTPGSDGILAIRADIDALAMHDMKDVEYRSTRDGVCHACGHDVHTVVALGVALFLADHPRHVDGRIRFVFQPEEERVPGGAIGVIDAGGLDGVDAIIGLHCEPKADVGRIGLREGPITSAADMVSIRIGGPGGHTARPELTVDTVGLAARLVTILPTHVDERLRDPVKLVFGAIHGGDASNAIPTSVEIRGSVRTASLDAWEHLDEVVARSVQEIIGSSGASIEIDYTRGVPPVVNDLGVVDLVRSSAERVLGADAIYEAPQSWGGDDFAWYTRRVPGAYVRLGVHDPSWDHNLDLHAGRFDVDERAIAIGVRLLATAASLRHQRSPA